MKGTLYECIAYLTECDPQKQYEVKEVKKRRSLTQNAYYWAMLNKLARKLRMGDTEVHLNMLREYGVCEVMSLSMSVPAGDYMRFYKGSSRMDSSEFSCLIEGMREECEAQGIDVATPEEIARMSFTEPERNDYGYGY